MNGLQFISFEKRRVRSSGGRSREATQVAFGVSVENLRRFLAGGRLNFESATDLSLGGPL